MKNKTFWKVSLVVLAASGCLILAASASELEPIKLEEPQTDAGKPLMQALLHRRSQRVFSAAPLPPSVLSNLLWAAFGVNRDDGKRTAPSARNMQEIEIYAAMQKGLYLYDAGEHVLRPVAARDVRAKAGRQAFTNDAPLCLIYVADLARMGNMNPADKNIYAAVDTGLISQNVYLFCSSEGLATVILGMVDKATLAKAMGLSSSQKIIFTQPVGYPKR